MVDRVELEPARYRQVTKTDPATGKRITAREVARFAIEADVCAEHREVRDRQGGQPLPDPRHREANGYEQVTIDDLLGGGVDG